jgi:hypothetical protein
MTQGVKSPDSKKKDNRKTLDFDPMRKLSYPNIQVTPRYHMVIDKPIEKDTDTRKLFTQNMNSPQYLVRRGDYPDEPIKSNGFMKIPDSSRYQPRSDIFMDGFTKMALLKSNHRQPRNFDDNFYIRSVQSARNSTRGMRTTTSSVDWKSISPKKSGIPDQELDKKFQVHSPVNLSWSLSKNFIKIPKMIERVPGENFIGKYETHACYDLPTCIGENMYTIPRFNKMSGRERRLNGNLLRNMNNLQKATAADAVPHDASRPVNINYEKMLRGFHKLGHI